MPVSRYNLAAQQPLINTYTPLPYQELLQGLGAKEMQQQAGISGIGKYGDREFQYLGADREQAIKLQSELDTKVDKLSGTDFTTPEGKRALREFDQWGKKVFGKEGAIGSMEANFNAYQAAIQRERKRLGKPTSQGGITQEQFETVTKNILNRYKGIGEGGIEGYRGIDIVDIATQVSSTEFADKYGKGIMSDIEAAAYANTEGNYIREGKSALESVSKEEVQNILYNYAKGDPALMNYLKQGEAEGYATTEELISAIAGAADKFAFRKETRTAGAKADPFALDAVKRQRDAVEEDSKLIDWKFTAEGMEYKSKSGETGNELKATIGGIQGRKDDLYSKIMQSAGANSLPLANTLSTIDINDKNAVKKAFADVGITTGLFDQFYNEYGQIVNDESLSTQKDIEAKNASGYTGADLSDTNREEGLIAMAASIGGATGSPLMEQKVPRHVIEKMGYTGELAEEVESLLRVGGQVGLTASGLENLFEGNTLFSKLSIEEKESFMNTYMDTARELLTTDPVWSKTSVGEEGSLYGNRIVDAAQESYGEAIKEYDPNYQKYNSYIKDNSTKALSVQSSWNLPGISATEQRELNQVRKTIGEIFKDPSTYGGYAIKSNDPTLEGKTLNEITAEKDLVFTGKGANSAISSAAITLTNQSLSGNNELFWTIPTNMDGENKFIYISTKDIANTNVEKIINSNRFKVNSLYNKGDIENLKQWSPPEYGERVTFNYANETKPIVIDDKVFSIKEGLGVLETMQEVLDRNPNMSTSYFLDTFLPDLK